MSPSDPDTDTARDPGPDLAAARQAMALLEVAETWPALRAALEAADLPRRLGASGMQRLADAWRRRTVGALTDAALILELRFWVEGGDLPHHPEGFRAPLPADLVAEAERRGWFVRPLGRGGWIVNPPDAGPLTVPARR
jgi:hypothetical protein